MKKNQTLKGLLVISAIAAMSYTVSIQAQTPVIAGQSDAIHQADSKNKLSAGGIKAVEDMAQANLNEIAAVRLALNKTKSSEVKAFAQQMVKDHTDALNKVHAVAHQKGVTLPTEPNAKHKSMAAELEKLNGDAFDKMYMKNAGTKDHKMVLSMLQSDATKIKDPEVKALVKAHTPVVEQHLKSAQQLVEESNKSSGK